MQSGAWPGPGEAEQEAVCDTRLHLLLATREEDRRGMNMKNLTREAPEPPSQQFALELVEAGETKMKLHLVRTQTNWSQEVMNKDSCLPV